MLDILMPMKPEDIPLAVTEFTEEDKVWFEGAIPSLVRDTDVPFRLHVVVDGGTREDVSILQRYLPTLNDWTLEQNDEPEGIAASISAMVSFSRAHWAAIITPNIWVRDPKWFGKMQVVFTKDPHCMIVAADVPETRSATMPPQRLDHKTHPSAPFILTSRYAARNVMGVSPLSEKDWTREFSQRAKDLGGTRWVASGVRYGDAHASQTTGPVEPA